MRRLPLFTLLLVLLCAAFAPSAQADDLVVQGTTDVRDAGLLDDVIVPGFEAANPGDTITYVPVGSGQAITNAEAGQGDALLVHAPTSEKPFVDGGYSLEPFGRAIFYSDYVIVGASTDPAHVAATARHDAVTAFEKIAAAGEAGTADFVSRGDGSGTNSEEKAIWKLTDVPLNSANEPAGPGGTGNPSWYHKGGGGQAETVQLAEQCPFTSGKCYDITDRGTYNRLISNGGISDLQIVSDKNDLSARGGMNLLTNPFTAYAVDPNKVPGANSALAVKFLDYLTSAKFQSKLKTYPNASSPAFHADARPKITASDPPSKRVAAKHQIKIKGTISSRLPGAASLQGTKLSLERSFSVGHNATRQRVVAHATADEQGNYEFTIPAHRTSKLRVISPTITPDLSIVPLIASGQLSPSTHNVGRVKVQTNKKHG